MIINFLKKDTESVCTDLNLAIRKYNSKPAKKLFKLINLISNADSLADVIVFRNLNFHDLHGDLEGSYSLDIDGRTCNLRLIVSFKDVEKETVFSSPSSINIIQVEEVSKHYGK